MVFVKEMFDQLNDLLEDYPPAQPVERQVDFDMKRHYLNMGQNAMWPRVYRIVQEEITVVEDETEYPVTALDGGRISFVEGRLDLVQDPDARYYMYPDESHTIAPLPPHGDVIRLVGVPKPEFVGGSFRVTSTMPLLPIVSVDDAATALEVYSGPEYTIEGPALYAMNRITARGLHARLDYSRVSVNQGNRAAVPNELMASSIFWLDEFERRVDQWQLVHPQSVR